MRVTLVNAQVLDGNNVVPPLGLLYIAAVLEKAGHDVQIFDADPEFQDSMLKEIKDFGPELIGLSFLTVAYERAFNLCKTLKKELPEVKFCAGGVHTTVKPHDTLKEMNLDFIVVGEGELTMEDVCNRLDKNESIKDAAGTMYRENGEVVENERRELIQDLDSIPFPARHLIDMAPYLKPPGIIRGYAEKKPDYNCYEQRMPL